MSKIKNVVFDYGNVLIEFIPKNMVSKYADSEEDAQLLASVVFDRLYWNKLDNGDITDQEVVADCRRRLPERLGEAAEQAYYNWIYNVPEIKGMRELTRYLKSRGIRLFILSNNTNYFVAHKDEFSLLDVFDKMVFSAPIKKVKPNADIFDYLCEHCDITPEETVFVDDHPSNIRSARELGFDAYHFDGDASKLKEYLDGVIA